jgi:hypothetical protein
MARASVAPLRAASWWGSAMPGNSTTQRQSFAAQ